MDWSKLNREQQLQEFAEQLIEFADNLLVDLPEVLEYLRGENEVQFTFTNEGSHWKTVTKQP